MRILKNQAGMSLIEILITLAILSVVSMGIASLITNLYKSQNQASVLQTLTALKTNFTGLILDGNSWANTVADTANTAFPCIRETPGGPLPPPCTGETSDINTALPSSYPAFVNMRDGSAAPGAIVFTGTGGNGYTADGRACTGFVAPPGVGNDACPIQYRFTVRYDCTGGGTCPKPMITVFATLTYNPSPNNPMRAVVNPTKYSAIVRRGTGVVTRNESVLLTHELSGGVGGGSCGVGTWIIRQFNSKTDPANNVVTGMPTASPVFNAGTYLCDAGAKGFSVQGFTIQIWINGTPRVDLQRSAFAQQGPGGQSEAIISRFQVTQSNNFTMQLRQNCEATPSSAVATDSDTFGLGLPIKVSGSYTQPTVYAFISCVRQF